MLSNLLNPVSLPTMVILREAKERDLTGVNTKGLQFLSYITFFFNINTLSTV